jgi:hypothetical protein
MNLSFRRTFYLFVTLLLVAVLPLPQDVFAQEHVVSSADLHRDLVAAAQARQNNQAKVLKFFSSEQAQKALSSANLRYEKVEKAVSQLRDDEVARLAAATEKVQNDFAAGALTSQQVTYIIIALATAVIILIIVAAR